MIVLEMEKLGSSMIFRIEKEVRKVEVRNGGKPRVKGRGGLVEFLVRYTFFNSMVSNF